MNTIFIIFFVLLAGILLFKIFTRKYLNPYKMIMVFGKKGAGKSTLLTKLALRYHRKGWNVYSTEVVPYSYKVQPCYIGLKHIKPRSVLLIDEVSLIWGNRDFKSFQKSVEQFFRYIRKYKIRVYLFSQTFDIDKKLRDLTDEMYLITNVLTVFSYGKKINKKIVLTEAQSDRPSTIAENLVFESFFFFWCGSRFFTFIPKYAKYFQSFNAPQLEEMEFEYNELPKSLRKGRSLRPSRLPRLSLSPLRFLKRKGRKSR